jgi:predicted RNA polymerase sigma factor
VSSLEVLVVFPVVALNQAVAVAMSGSIADGLNRIEDLGRMGALDRYYLFHAARGSLAAVEANGEAAAGAKGRPPWPHIQVHPG